MTFERPLLPSGWEWSRIDRVAAVSARIGWKALTAAEYVPEGYAFLSTPNIKSDTIDFQNVNYITEWRYLESPELMLQPGDVLLVKDGNTLGITNVIRTLPGPATVNGSIAILRPGPIEPRFLRYVLASDMTQGIISSLRAGMGVPHLFQADIKKMPVPVPDQARQRLIADYLDAETARIDALIEKKQTTRTLLRERTQSIIARSWPGKLIYSVDGRPAGIEGWQCVRLGHLAVVQTGVTLDGGREVGFDAVTRPYLRVANVQDGALDLTEVKEVTVPHAIAARCSLQPGDVLMTEGGDPDKLGRGTVWPGDISPCLHQNHVFAVRPRARLLPEYLALITRTPYARAYFEMTASKTTGIASTSTAKIVSFRIPIVLPEIQRQIVSSVNNQLDEVEKLRLKVETQVALLAEHRQALITAAVTGVEIPRVAA